MRTLLAFLFTAVAVTTLLLSLRGDASESIDLSTPAPEPEAEARGTWPCSDFSEATAVADMPVEWSYRLCGRGERERSVEIRFRNAGGAADSLEYRAWLVRPADCNAPVWAGPRRIVLPGRDRTATDALAVPFEDYHGELWVCARPIARSGEAWTPRRARHGNAV